MDGKLVPGLDGMKMEKKFVGDYLEGVPNGCGLVSSNGQKKYEGNYKLGIR